MSETETQDLDSVIADYLQAAESGHAPNPAEWIARHPAHAPELRTFFADLGLFGSFLGLSRASSTDDTIDYRDSTSATPVERFGEYELIAEIGRGAMGIVYRARVAGTQLVVALKQVQTDRSGGAEAIARFREEVENISALRHPNIVPIFHVGESNGRPFFTMALVEGGSLEDHLDRYKGEPRRAAELVAKIARAVHHAHQRRLLHRDLKPSNIMLDAAGEPLVADFGLATRLGESGSASVGGPAGSLPWMPPEAVRGDSLLTTGIDVWALGVILFELLTGERPFRGETREELKNAILKAEPIAPRIADRDLDAIVRRCLMKDADRRYESAASLANDLDRWLRDEPVRARPTSRHERFTRWLRRHPVLAGGTVTLIHVLAVAVWAAFSVANEQEERLRFAVCEGNAYAARHVASTILARLQDRGEAVRSTARDPALHRACAAGDWPTVEQLLKRRQTESGFATVFVLDSTGVIRAEWPQSNRVVGQNFADRDYFRGAIGRVGEVGEGAHFSRVFRSKNDGLDKLAVSVAFRPDGKEPWVLGATLPADATFGLDGLHDNLRKAVLLAPRDVGTRDEHPQYVVLIHPGYAPREPTVDVPAESLRPGFGPNDDYADPVAVSHPDFAGRWLAGFAPVADTELVVLVQQPYEEAMSPHRTVIRRTLEWVAGLLALGLVVVGVIWLDGQRKRARVR